MFKVKKNEKKNEKSISKILPTQNDIKYLFNSFSEVDQLFSSLKDNIYPINSSINSYSNKLDETNFTVSKTTIKEKEIESQFLQKKMQFQIYNKNESSNEPKKMFSTRKRTNVCSRWSKKEKLKFLECFYKYGFDWKKIYKNITSRTPTQIRSHAQKFLLILRKFKDDSLGIDFTNNIYNDREKLLNKIREIIDNNKKGNILMELTNKLYKKNLLSERVNYKNNLNNLNYNNNNIIHNNDFSEIKEEKSEINEQKKFNSRILDNNIYNYNSNYGYSINDFNENINNNTFVYKDIDDNKYSNDKSDIDFNNSLIIDKINYNNNLDLLMKEKYFKEKEYIQNIDQENITNIEEMNKNYLINENKGIVDYQFDF